MLSHAVKADGIPVGTDGDGLRELDELKDGRESV